MEIPSSQVVVVLYRQVVVVLYGPGLCGWRGAALDGDPGLGGWSDWLTC